MFLPGNYAKEIAALQVKWCQVAESGSVDGYAELMTDDFFCVTLEGALLSRDELLESIRNKTREVMKMTVSGPPLARFLGETALVNAVVEYEVNVDGIKYQGPFLMTGVFIRMDGVWKTACYHTSDLRVKTAFESRFRKSKPQTMRL